MSTLQASNKISVRKPPSTVKRVISVNVLEKSILIEALYKFQEVNECRMSTYK